MIYESFGLDDSIQTYAKAVDVDPEASELGVSYTFDPVN